MAEAGERMICAADALIEGGNAVCFTVMNGGEEAPAFVVRFGGRAHAYLNRCAHRGIKLDWDDGRFFDRHRRYLICAMHGALYEPASGGCVAGPCSGGLVKLAVIEKNSAVYLAPAETSGSTRGGQ